MHSSSSAASGAATALADAHSAPNFSGLLGIEAMLLNGEGAVVLWSLAQSVAVFVAVAGLKAWHRRKQHGKRQHAVEVARALAPGGVRAEPEDASSSRSSIDAELATARAELGMKEEQLQALQAELATRRFSVDQKAEVAELKARLRGAQEELVSAGARCRAAAEKAMRMASDLAVAETQLRVQRTQLQQASAQLQQLQGKLEETEGELGLTRSQNLLFQREVELLRRQLEGMARRSARVHADYAEDEE